MIDLCSGEGAVDTGCGFCRVATEEACTISIGRGSFKRLELKLTLLIQNEDISTVQVDCVGGTETGHYASKSPGLATR